MEQTAPDAVILKRLVDGLTYKPGWEFGLAAIDRGQGCAGLTLIILIAAPDTNNPQQISNVVHYMPVPAAAYNEVSWRRWLLDQLLLVERHEACEFFRINGEQVFAPNHGPGYDPYTIRELTTEQARRTNFRGEVVGDND